MRAKEKPRQKTGLDLAQRDKRESLCFGSLCGLNQDVTAGASLVDELDGAGNLGEERVILAAANVGAGLNAGAALADDDGAAGDKLAAESFYAKALRVGVAPISGTA